MLEPENQLINQNLKQKTDHASFFENFFFLRTSDFVKGNALIRNEVFTIFARENDNLWNLCAFLKSTILREFFFQNQILIQNFYNVSDFEYKFFQHVRF